VLGHAAGDAEHHARTPHLEAGELAQAAVDPLLGMLPDRAGVDQDDVRLTRPVDALVSAARSVPSMISESATFIWQPAVSM
jgi:hypothetical protein